MSLVLQERVDGIAILRLNRPERLNVLSEELCALLSGMLQQLCGEDSLRALILTGEGKAFSAGTDLNELSGSNEGEAVKISERGQQLCDSIEQFPVPVIAAVNGIAAGGGCELALACHLRIASSTASFSLPETKLGLIPAYGATQRLPREIGAGRAYEIMLTGRTLVANEADELGLVNRVVDTPNLISESLSLAREIEKLSPLAIRACLKAVTCGLVLPIDEGLTLERELFASLFATEDAREGLRAFLEKRTPVFKGK